MAYKRKSGKWEVSVGFKSRKYLGTFFTKKEAVEVENKWRKKMRCDKFYEKWQKAGNFCEKNPRTAEQIEAYLDEMRVLSEKAANCSTDKELAAIAEIEVSETALRPLVSQKNLDVIEEVEQQIVNLSKEKA